MPVQVPSGSAVAYDPSDGYVVAFGGLTVGYGIVNTSRIFNGTWSTLSASLAPPPRTAAGLAWDPVDGYLVLFGGAGTSPLNDTWTFHSGKWTQLHPAVSPSARWLFSLTWDASRGMVVLFGGITLFGFGSGTWGFVGGEWAALATNRSPAVSEGQSLSYDPDRGVDALYGGTSSGGDAQWTFGPDGWGEDNASYRPSSHYYSGFAYDPILGGNVLFGGIRTGGGPILGPETWLCRSGVWQNLSQAGASTPPYLYQAPLVYYPPMGSLLLVDGIGWADHGANTTWALYKFNVTAVIAPTEGLAPLNVSFNASALGGYPPYVYAWNAGDGTVVAGSAAEHTYRDPGVYLPYVSATDTNGASASASGVIHVYAPLNISAVVAPLTGDAPLTVDASAATVGGSPPVTIVWTFAPGAVATAAAAQYTYTFPGIFVIQLGVTDGDSEFETRSWTILVSQWAPSPLTVDASAAPAFGVAPLRVAFSETATGGASPILSTWAFGDGGSSIATSPVHTYLYPGVYTVDLTVLDRFGNRAAWDGTVEVDAALVVAAGGSITTGPAPLNVTFAGSATGGTPNYTYLWTFGDGRASSESDATHTYPDPGRFTAVFYVWDANGTLRTAAVNVTVSGAGPHPPPTNASQAPGAASTDWVWLVGIAIGFVAGAAWAAVVPLRHRSRGRRSDPPVEHR